MFNLTPAQQQMLNIMLTVFSASGPLVGQLLIKQGVDQTTINMLSTWLTTVGPLILSAIIVYIIHTPANMASTASKVDGIDVTANKDASPAVIKAALDKGNDIKMAA